MKYKVLKITNLKAAHLKRVAFDLFSFFYVLLKWQKIETNPSIRHAMRWGFQGEQQLHHLWNGRHSKDDPLKIEILQKKVILTSIHKEYFHYNPVISFEASLIRIFWRISDYSVSNWPTLPIGLNPISEFNKLKNVEFIGTGLGSLDHNSELFTLKDEITLKDIEISNLDEHAPSDSSESQRFYLEDPRTHEGSGKFITAMIRFGKIPTNKMRMLLINLHLNQGTIISTISDRSIEKNWVTVREEDNRLLMLKQSNPPQFVEIELNSGKTALIKSENIATDYLQSNLNGGSPFVLVNSTFYLRVARMQFPVYGIGITRINILVMHDLSFREILRSMPFVFNSLGVEVCNGFALKDDRFFFAWGEEDRKMYIGTCEKATLLEWFYANLQE